MSDANLIDQMYGIPDPGSRDLIVYRDISRSMDVTLKDYQTRIRGFEYRNAGRGVNLADGQDTRYYAATDDNFSTAFPTAATRAASWDLALETQVGEAIGDETMGSKNNVLLAPCMNLLRHPYWGRSQETYGEDVYQVGRMATALTVGLQQHVVACAKHFAANNIENNRQAQNVSMNEQTLREIFTRHFGMVVQDGGVGCVLASYNMINNVKSTQNKHLLRDILKDGWGYQGFVISDWWAMPGDQGPVDPSTAGQNAAVALAAGLDDEVPWSLNYSQLNSMLSQDSTTNRPLIQDSATRVVRQKVRFNSHDPNGPFGLGTAKTSLNGSSLINTDDHLALSETVDVESKVLLKNGLGSTPVLPIDTSKVTNIAVVGIDWTMQVVEDSTEYPKTGKVMHFATDVNLGDRGSSRVNADPATSVGPTLGITNYLKSKGLDSKIRVTSGNSADAAANADFIVVVVGLTAGDEGEEYSIASHGDRSSLALPGGTQQTDLVNTVLGYNKPTVILVESGSVVEMPWLNDTDHPNQATVWGGYGGNREGNAYARLLFGDANFSGKLPVTWVSQAQLDQATQNGFIFAGASETTVEDYFFGYRYYDKNGITPLFPFGSGLSYTSFGYSNLQIPCGSVSSTGVDRNTGVVNVTVDVENTGSRDGDEIVMLFVQGPQNPANVTGKRPVKELKRFQRVSLKASGQSGSKVRVTLPLSIWELRHWEGNDTTGKWVIDPGQYTIMVGKNAGDLSQTGTLTVN